MVGAASHPPQPPCFPTRPRARRDVSPRLGEDLWPPSSQISPAFTQTLSHPLHALLTPGSVPDAVAKVRRMNLAQKRQGLRICSRLCSLLSLCRVLRPALQPGRMSSCDAHLVPCSSPRTAQSFSPLCLCSVLLPPHPRSPQSPCQHSIHRPEFTSRAGPSTKALLLCLEARDCSSSRPLAAEGLTDVLKRPHAWAPPQRL